MNPKTLTIFAFIAIVLISTSMVMVEQLNLQDLKQDEKQNSSLIDLKDQKHEYHKGMITIKLKEGLGDFDHLSGKVELGITSLDEKFGRFKVYALEKRFSYIPDKRREDMPDLSRIYKISFPEKTSVLSVVSAFRDDPNIEYAEAIPVMKLCETPDDELFDDLYHLQLIQAENAWDIHKGENGPEVVIGIVDDAVDWRHDDLIDNVWENLGEDFDGDGHVIEFNGSEWIFDPDDENGIDDDGNGKIDDFVGWDFINEFGEQDNDPEPNQPDIDHGTHCMGIANSRTNNSVFVASIPWNVKFVTAKCANDGDLYFDYDAWEALIYIAELGVDIITNSWSGGNSQANREVIEYAQGLGCIIVSSAGNNDDEMLTYPASYPGVVSVGASSMIDTKASFSSYGIFVDVFAPGVNIRSLRPNNMTQQMSGTSMACPLVAGQLALMKSYYTGWTNEMLIEQLCATSDDIDTVNQTQYANKLGYGRINAYRALSEINPEIEEVLKLRVMDKQYVDEDEDGILEPGENVFLDFELINFSIGLDTVPVTFTLSTTSPYVNMVSDQFTGMVPSDNTLWFDSAFVVQVSPDIDSTQLIEFTINASAAMPIPLENDWPMQILINQSGVFVYDGIGTGNAYSGEYIRDFLHENGVPVFYSNAFPSSLNGFDAAFLSFGNYGEDLGDGTLISEEMANIIIEYLYSGGYVFEDCASFFGLMKYNEYGILEEIQSLFGVDTIVTPMTTNIIDSLCGISASLAEGLAFNSTMQYPVWYIDILTPDSNGVAMLEEYDYGVVGVQGEGIYGQKTVSMSYAIAYLQDSETGTRDQLLAEIAGFFGFMIVDVEEPGNALAGFELSIFPNPASSRTNLQYRLEEDTKVSISLFDVGGGEVMRIDKGVLQKGEYQERIEFSGLKSGLYLVNIQAGRKASSAKILLK
ncbi:MAG: S8/S53 family peptidase [Bacteroidales bacterium]|jgi:subtilisin family serine protease|nr:S8/S53 family peptidase [Bacteroidales bacterium]